MSDEQRMVCKHCGGEDFHAEATASGWVDSTGVWVGDNGKPRFESSGGLQDAWDYDIDSYVCSTCQKAAGRIEDLVTTLPTADGESAPCVRCEHGRHEHPELKWNASAKPYYARGPMPCDHDGCDCHDYFDPAVAPDVASAA